MLSSTSLNLKRRREDLNSAHRQQCATGKRDVTYFLPSVLMRSSALLILEHPSSSSKKNEALVSGQFGDYPTVEPDVISRESARMSQNFLPGGSIPLAEVSPFILHLLYQGCIILSSSSREPRAEDANSLILLQEALKVLTQRWLASGRILSPIYSVPSLSNMILEAYLNILAARKAMLEI